MKVLLIVIAAFHYNGGVAATTIPFYDMPLCEAARAKLVAEHKSPDGWGRVRMTAVCVPVSR